MKRNNKRLIEKLLNEFNKNDIWSVHRDVFMIRLADNWNEQILPHAWSGLVSQRSFWLQCSLTKKKEKQRERERIKKEADQMLFCSLQEKAVRKLLFKVHSRFQNTILHATDLGLVLFAVCLSEVGRTERDINYLFRVASMKKRPLHHPYPNFIFP